MAYPQVIIPPSVKPVSPMELTLADDLTTPFQPRFGRGTTQRQTWGDPVWSAQVRFESLRAADRALVKAALMGARGGASNILMTPGIPLRGSFPATELLTNNDFSGGTTGWTADGNSVGAGISVADRVARVKATGYNAYIEHFIAGGVSATQYAPCVARAFFSGSNIGDTNSTTFGPYIDAGANSTSNYSVGFGMKSVAAVTTSAGGNTIAVMLNAGIKAGDFYDSPYISLSRCALIDNGPNALLQSDTFGTTWTLGTNTVSSNSHTAPDGTATADSIVESGSTNVEHYVVQPITVTSAAADISFSISVATVSRGWCVVRLTEDTGSTSAYVFVNLSNGAVGTSAAGANWSNVRAHVVSQGAAGVWYRITVTARKTNAATSIQCILNSATSDGAFTYAGAAATVACAMWRGCASASSVPTRGAQTTTTATTGTAQSGGQLYVKGLPVSTSGLLLTGDFFEINGELKQCTASLDSDAAGLGVLQFAPGLTVAAADNDPVIILNPMGRFRLAQDPRITERFGVYTDVDLALIEATA